jgi:hypothetical protein
VVPTPTAATDAKLAGAVVANATPEAAVAVVNAVIWPLAFTVITGIVVEFPTAV